MDGAINVLKPPGMSSHDVVNEIRKTTGERRVGHAGTLDPAAAGVLPVLVGKAVRLSEFLVDKVKSYRVEAVLGVVTPTFDLTSEPEHCTDASDVRFHEVRLAAAGLVGFREQLVPSYSAVKVGGRRLYKMARAGIDVPQMKRVVNIISLEIVSMTVGRNPRVTFDITCSRGTYVRTVCHELGQKLGVGGAMSFLLRTRVGAFVLEESNTLEEIRSDLTRCLRPLEFALRDCPRAVLTARAAARLRYGIKPSMDDFINIGYPVEGQLVTVHSPDGSFLAVAQYVRGAVQIRKVFVQ